jgi:group I intron endonuclease
MSPVAGIYSITSKVNQKIYIGSSAAVLGRCRDHRYKLRKGVHANRHLQAHVNKYGLDDLVFETIEVEHDPKLRFGLEQLLVSALYGKGCFNLAIDVTAPTAGKTLSAEHRAKIGAAHKGRKCSLETLERMREAHKDTRPSQKCMDRNREVMADYVPTPETRKKTSLSQSLRWSKVRKESQ